jgi:hypothetical protein|tara:strand:+ start:50147 stop:50293 length:147 start_codon:yes stop_codon:yes gene_type:complete
MEPTAIVAVREPITIPLFVTGTSAVAMMGIVNQIPAPPKPARAVPTIN